jgi:hypothetical protein
MRRATVVFVGNKTREALLPSYMLDGSYTSPILLGTSRTFQVQRTKHAGEQFKNIAGHAHEELLCQNRTSTV